MTRHRLRKKWKELEKKFKQEHSKALVKPSGSGTDEIYKPAFLFYDQLQFLTAISETDETLDWMLIQNQEKGQSIKCTRIERIENWSYFLKLFKQ